MANVKKSIIGSLQGSLSNIVFRERNGKVVAYTKPSKQRISKSEAAVKARNKFGLTVAFAKEINSNEILAKIWVQLKVKATNSYQKIIKINSKLTDSNSLSLKNKITPDGLPFKGFSAEYKSNVIKMTLNFENTSGNLLKSEKLFCMVYVWKENSKPTKLKYDIDYRIRLFEFNLKPPTQFKEQSFECDIKSIKENSFDNGIIYIALAGSYKSKLICSSTISKRFI